LIFLWLLSIYQEKESNMDLLHFISIQYQATKTM
jgi:hypothetical protein